MMRSDALGKSYVSSHSYDGAYEASVRMLRDVTSYQLAQIEGKDEDMHHPCPICLCKLDRHITLIHCGHSICDACATHWFRLNSSCPICKKLAGFFLRGKLEESLKIYELQGENSGELTESQIERGIMRHQAAWSAGNSVNKSGGRRAKRKHKDECDGDGNRRAALVDDEDKDEETSILVKMPNKDAAEVGLITSSRYRGAYLEFDILYKDVNNCNTLEQTFGKSESVLIDITHVYVPKRMRGKGIAEKLTRRGIRIAEGIGCKVRPTCSYVKETFFGKKYPEIGNSVCEE